MSPEWILDLCNIANALVDGGISTLMSPWRLESRALSLEVNHGWFPYRAAFVMTHWHCFGLFPIGYGL
jgi:hypothetical protein